MAGSKRKADMALSGTDESSETYASGDAETVHETEGGARNGYGYGYGYGYDYGCAYGNGDVLEDVVNDDEVTQAEMGPDEGKGMIDPPFELLLII